jgi:hypothetical protein
MPAPHPGMPLMRFSSEGGPEAPAAAKTNPGMKPRAGRQSHWRPGLDLNRMKRDALLLR